MSLGVLEQDGTLTAVSGDASVTVSVCQGVLAQIYVETETEATTFDVKITNARGVDIFDSQQNTGYLNEAITLPVRGTFTLSIENETADEDLTYYISIIERYA